MRSFSSLYVLTALALSVSAAPYDRRQEGIPLPPSARGAPYSVNNTLTRGESTDFGTIFDTAHRVKQRKGPDVSDTPNEPVSETAITAVDGDITSAGAVGEGVPLATREIDSLEKRAIGDYNQVFAGTGTGPDDRDGSIQGTAYLTFTIVSNATYNVEACLNFCDSVQGCVFANLYYEFNNYGLDFEAHEQSNLKCAVYGDVHTAAEKTNLGGQQSYPAPAPLIYIQQSSGWAKKSLVDPATPDGYELVFGPVNGANNADGYMGFTFLDRYDVDACAQECNNRGPDPVGGACKYFNIWRAVVNGNPTTYTCSMYYLPADQSTATNTGQGDLRVTYSRGYKKRNYVVDGGFESYTCGDFCFDESSANWIGTGDGTLSATIFHWQPYAHAGSSVGLLGSATGADDLPGTLTPTQPLQTTAGKTYQIAFWQNSAFSGPIFQADSFIEVIWNGNVVQTLTPGYSPWTFHTLTVTAVGNDVLAFRGGKAPAWTFIDDISVWLA